MAAIDAQLDGVKMLDDMLNRIKREPMSRLADFSSQWKIDHEIMTKAVPVMWTMDTIEAVMHAATSVPGETLINTWNLDTDAVWWYFDTPLPVQTVSNEEIPIRALSCGWVYGKKTVWTRDTDTDRIFVMTAW